MRRTWTLIALIAGATVAAAVAHYAGAPSLLTFVIATAALAGLAWIVSFSTEQVGERFGPAVTGLLQSTLGNLPEFFIVVFALQAGEVVIAQTSIVGSIFANALLVLGLVTLAGCRESEDGVMRFLVRLPKDNVTLMILASFLIVLIGISSQPATRRRITSRRSRSSARSRCSSPTPSGSSTTSARMRRGSRHAGRRAARLR